MPGSFVKIASCCMLATLLGDVQGVPFFRDPLPEAQEAMKSSENVVVEEMRRYARFSPAQHVKTHDTCLIFFSGGLVEAPSYAPLIQAVAAEGYLSFLMFLRRANAAKEDASALRHCNKFVLGGHSLGGILAANYVGNNDGDGLLLLASRAAFDVSDITGPVTSIYGSRDCGINNATLTEHAGLLPAHTKYVEIVGGDHKQFGWYADDKVLEPECVATITREEQFAAVLPPTLELLASM